MGIIAFIIGCFLTASVIGVDRVKTYFFTSLAFMFLHAFMFPDADLEAFTAIPVLTATWLFIFLGIVWIAHSVSGKPQSNTSVNKTKKVKVFGTGDVIKTSTRGHVAQVGALRFGLDFREGEYSVKIIKHIEDETYEGLFLSDGEETTIKCQVIVSSDKYSTFIKSLWPLNRDKYFSQNKFIDRTLKDTDASVPELLKIHEANIIK